MEFTSLPEEKIVEICEKMDDITLSNFVKVSSDNYRMCNKILQNRKAEYMRLINEFIEKVKITPNKTGYGFSEIMLTSYDPNRIFFLSYSRNNMGFSLEENLSSSVFALQKIKATLKYYVNAFANIKAEDDVRRILLDLFINGYLSGEYNINPIMKINKFHHKDYI